MLDFDKYKTTLPYATTRPSSRRTRKTRGRLEDQFKADALAAVGLTGHPKADKAYSYAWTLGHASGYSEVFSYLQDIAEVLRD